MHGIARVGMDTAGGIIEGGGQDFVTVEGGLWAVKGDAVEGHGKGHQAPTMNEGSGFIRIGGIPVCREGHMATCEHTATGSQSMRISD